MIKVFYYDSIVSYKDENPPVELDVKSIEIDNDVVTIIDSEGVKQYLKDFFALTYKNDYYFDNPNINVYMYGSLASYSASQPFLTEEVSEITVQDGFAVLKNQYTQIINLSKLVALSQVKKDGSLC